MRQAWGGAWKAAGFYPQCESERRRLRLRLRTVVLPAHHFNTVGHHLHRRLQRRLTLTHSGRRRRGADCRLGPGRSEPAHLSQPRMGRSPVTSAIQRRVGEVRRSHAENNAPRGGAGEGGHSSAWEDDCVWIHGKTGLKAAAYSGRNGNAHHARS